jgi:hypothetical protein
MAANSQKRLEPRQVALAWTRCWQMGFAAGLATLLTGCSTCEECSLTYRVWDCGDFRNFNEPAPEPKITLCEAPGRGDVLVQYDASSEKSSVVKRQAYYLWANHERILTKQKPKFIKTSNSEGLRPIPVFDATASNSLASAGTQYAVAAPDNRSFTLYQQDGTSETFDLPIYQQSYGTITRVALTPVAVVGDAAMVGGVAAFVAFYALAESGASFTVH